MQKAAKAGLAALILAFGLAGCSSDDDKEKPVVNEDGNKQSERDSNDTGK